MSILETNKVDFVTVDEKENTVKLVIADSLEWQQATEHELRCLQNKIYRYFDFIESGEMNNRFPETINRSAVIELVSKNQLSDNAKKLVEQINKLPNNPTTIHISQFSEKFPETKK